MKRLIFVCLTTLAFAPALDAASPPSPQPLTFANVRSFFSDTLHIRPAEVQKRCIIFYEGEWLNSRTYNYSIIIVENSDEDLQVTFYLTDDSEMNWVNEFIDSAFFTRPEKESLFRLLYQKHNTRGERVGRFRVDLSHWEPRHAEIIVLGFTPLRRRSSH